MHYTFLDLVLYALYILGLSVTHTMQSWMIMLVIWSGHDTGNYEDSLGSYVTPEICSGLSTYTHTQTHTKVAQGSTGMHTLKIPKQLKDAAIRTFCGDFAHLGFYLHSQFPSGRASHKYSQKEQVHRNTNIWGAKMSPNQLHLPATAPLFDFTINSRGIRLG